MRVRARHLTVLALLGTLLFCWPACSSPNKAQPDAPKAEPLKFGVILVGAFNDKGWSEAHYTAGKYVESKIPNTKMIFIDSVNPSAKPGVTVPQLADDMIARGAKLIITTSDDFQDGTLEAAQRHPEVCFLNVSGDFAWKEGKNCKAPPNYSNVMGRMEYGKFIMGYAAALTTQTGKIGYLGPLANDETRRLTAAAYLGARHAWTTVRKRNPNELKYKVTWIGFWFNIPGQTLDPTKVANDFYTSGYDVVLSGIDTTEALIEAGKLSRAAKKVWAMPYDYKDGCAEAEDVALGVPYFNWGPAYVKAVNLALQGKWEQYWDWNGPDWKNIADPDSGAIGFTKGQALSRENAALVDALVADLGSGKVQVFKGPLNFQDGAPYLKDGEVAKDLAIWYFPKLLQGMEGAGK